MNNDSTQTKLNSRDGERRGAAKRAPAVLTDTWGGNQSGRCGALGSAEQTNTELTRFTLPFCDLQTCDSEFTCT